MKSFIRTIIVFLVLNLVTGSFTLAEEATVEADFREEEVYEYDPDTQKLLDEGVKQYEPMLEYFKKRRGLNATPPRPSAAGRVLVIPAAETKAKEVAAIMEDMNVMSRIFDKKLREAHMISNVGIYSYDGGYGGYGGGYGGYGYGRGRTEGIFLDDYGALFLMKVNFPLLAPPQAEEKEQTKEPGDRVWEETKREIYSMEDVRTLKRRRSISITRPTKKFDAEKVEELRRKLIKTLKHATNIQNLKPDEWVIVTVIGAGSRAGIIRTEIITGTKNQVVVEGGDKRSYIIEAPLPPEVGYRPGGVVTIRVKKSDVDAFAAGEMDFDKFREEAQIFTY